jgi:hypothetical protein
LRAYLVCANCLYNSTHIETISNIVPLI